MNERLNSVEFPAPLRPASDMSACWRDVDLDFDAAAQQFVERHRSDGAVHDLPVMDLRMWAVAPTDGRFALRPLLGHEPARVLRSSALSMLCSRLGAPAEFIRRLPAPVQLGVMNWLLAQGDRPATAMLRLRGDQVTAIVSERYAPLDALELVDTLRAALARHGLLGQVRVRAVATGVTDVLRLVLPGEAHAVKVGDISLVALDISTSSFGRSAVHVRGAVFRLICSNGLRAPSGMGDLAFRHLGEAQRLRDGVSQGVATALGHARGLLDQWKRAVGEYIEGLGDFILNLRELTQSEQRAVRAELGASKPSDLPKRAPVYEVANALTSVAHGVEPARRLELEGIAGRVVLNLAGSR